MPSLPLLQLAAGAYCLLLEPLKRAMETADLTTQFSEGLRIHRLCGIGERGIWAQMHFNQQPIGPTRHGSAGHGWDEQALTGAMTWVYHNGQMGQLMQEWNTGQVEQVAGVARIKAADTTLTQD